MLVLKRKHAKWADRARAYKVILDGEGVGEIKDGETKEFPLPDGTHTLLLKIDWCCSQTVVFTSKDSSPVFAACAPAKKPFLSELLYITVYRDRYIDLFLTQEGENI